MQQRFYLSFKKNKLTQLITLAALLAALCLFTFASSWAQSSQLGFGVDRGIQFVDPAGLNSVPFWLTTGPATVDFKLYNLTPTQFIQRYATYNPWNAPTIDVAGLPVQTTWQQGFAGGDSWNMQPVTLPTATVPSGIFVIEATQASAGQARSMIAVGRTVLVLKQGSGGQVVAWASRLQNGEPVSGMTVTIYNMQANGIAQGVTNASGIVELNVGQAASAPLMAIGQIDAETTLAGIDWQWQNYAAYNYWSNPNGNAYTIYLHTERPLYRPGHTVYYNAIIRNNLPGGYTPLAASQPVSMTLRDSRNNVVENQVKTADEFGALTGEFTLSAAPPLGEYSLELVVAGQTQRQTLRVEEYQKPEYEVKVTTPAAFAISGDAIPVTVAADYFFGQPVANARVKLQIYRSPLYYYNYWWWYGHPSPPYYDGLVTELTGVTDANGRWNTTFTPESIVEYSANYRFKATVTDARERPIEGEQSVPVYWNSFELSAQPDRYGYQQGEAINVQLTAQGHDQSPVVNQSITVRIVRDYWETNQSENVAPSQTVITDGAGKVQAVFSNLPSGWYRLIASSSDARGRKIETYNYLWVFDPNNGYGWYWNNDEITITADRDSYAPGDTARLLIQSRVRGVALLTLERAGVHTEQIVTLNGPMTAVDVPITADLAPNVYARVHIFKRSNLQNNNERNAEGSLVSAATELVVPATNKKLTIAIESNVSTYKPGEQASLMLRVTNGGQGVRARVSLAIVDEALFAIEKDRSPAIFATFYGRQGDSVLLYDSLVRHPYGALYPTEADGGTPTPAPTGTPGPPTAPTTDLNGSATPRRLFLDTAYWNAAIVTGQDGVATITVPLPDNLTTWRIIARAVTVDTLVGEAQAKILVTKEIIARPALPRFAVVGDRFQVGIVAQNFSGGDASGNSEFRADHLVLLEPAAQAINLPNRGTTVSDWTAVAAQMGSGLISATINTDRGVDIVELPLQTKAFAAPERWSASGQAAPAAETTFTVAPNAVNEASGLTVRLSSSLALGLLDGLDELIDFPYGCVEQTMSRVLPSAVAAKAYADLGIPNPKAAELPAIIKQGLQMLYGFQHSDGGWGWFYDDNGNGYITAYVLFGLISVRDAGFTVDGQVLDKGFAHLDGALPGMDNGTKAFALYVKAAAQRGNLPQAQALINQSAQLDVAAQAALALALHLGGDASGANTVLDQIIARAKQTGVSAYWPYNNSGGDWYNWNAMTSTEKNTALAVRALTLIRPSHALLPKAVRWLMDNRNGAAWGGYGSPSTQATAFAVLGLTDYIKLAGELEANYHYTVSVNGATIASGQVTPATARQPIPAIRLAGDKLRIGENSLRIERDSSTGQLYYSALLRQELFYDSFTAVSSVDEGLALKRSYKLQEGAPRTDGAYNVGDLVEVTLELDASERMAYVLLEDPLPAGFEGVLERMNQYGWGYCPYCFEFDHFWWPEWGYNYKDVRDQKVDFFITELWPGKHTYTYLMRATTPGEFSVLPGQAYPMYNETVWGRSASQQVKVAPEALAPRPALAGDFDRSCQISRFDAQLVAAAYGTQNSLRNVQGDARIDLRDVTAVAARTGANCQSDKTMPGQGSGAVNLAVTSGAQTVTVGQTFSADVSLAGTESAASNATTLGGWGLTLHYDPTKMGVAKVTWNPALGNLLPLGPTIDEAQGTVVFGAMQLETASVQGPLATITFVGRGVGQATLSVDAAEAVDSQGQRITATAQAAGVVTVDGEQVFFPLIGK